MRGAGTVLALERYREWHSLGKQELLCAGGRLLIVEPSITVIVPNRNDSRYLCQCIRSVFESEVPADELIIVDDHSTDDSVAIARSLIRNESRAELVENRAHLGTIGALNEGLRRAHGDYVLLLSSNDFVLPGLFAHAKSCLARAHPPGLWSAMVWMVDEEGCLIRMHPSPVVSLNDAWFSPAQCLELAGRFGNWFTGTTLFFHRETLQEIGGLDPAYGGLSDLLAALTVACRRGAAYTPEPLGVMRVHADGFLSRTLMDVAGLEAIVSRIHEQGPRIEYRLFTQTFLHRLTHRLRFAAVRVSGGQAIPEFAPKYSGFRQVTLRLVGQHIPAHLVRVRVALSFLILRPFDVLPTLWYRFMGAAVVLLRTRLRNNGVVGSGGMRGRVQGKRPKIM